jgi:hypothetical protein
VSLIRRVSEYVTFKLYGSFSYASVSGAIHQWI